MLHGSCKFYVPAGIRTRDKRFRRPLLYPTELLVQIVIKYTRSATGRQRVL
ncbi:hypothetical protein LPIBR_40228 [Lacticaseibacillus paracasei]|nr:hypothetical protein LPIBR_40228 [Lacticaseibacillus paracasei]